LDINNHHGKDRISATGKVRWVKKFKRKALLDEQAGIEFVDIVPADAEKLLRFQ
jgi:hypothetical protein